MRYATKKFNPNQKVSLARSPGVVAQLRKPQQQDNNLSV